MSEVVFHGRLQALRHRADQLGADPGAARCRIRDHADAVVLDREQEMAVAFAREPDADFSGYNFWLGKLDEFNGNFIQAEMVKAFLDSIEYKRRFGQ